MADTSHAQADELLLKVQQAVKGPPWYMKSPPVVCQ